MFLVPCAAWMHVPDEALNLLRDLIFPGQYLSWYNEAISVDDASVLRLRTEQSVLP